MQSESVSEAVTSHGKKLTLFVILISKLCRTNGTMGNPNRPVATYFHGLLRTVSQYFGKKSII